MDIGLKNRWLHLPSRGKYHAGNFRGIETSDG